MNTRIKEIAYESMNTTIITCGVEDVYDGCYVISPIQLEKFAELIIRECADLFEVEWGDEKLTGNDVGYIVKKHFGVEE